MEKCFKAIRHFLLTHNLSLNYKKKTELLSIGSKQQLNKVGELSSNVGNTLIAPSHTAKNLGVIFDSKLCFTKHINKVCKKSSFQLYGIKQIRKYLTEHTTTTIVNAFTITLL